VIDYETNLKENKVIFLANLVAIASLWVSMCLGAGLAIEVFLGKEYGEVAFPFFDDKGSKFIAAFIATIILLCMAIAARWVARKMDLRAKEVQVS
jgi:hypothetical protein